MDTDMRFEDQLAVVTGAGRGIGRAIALRFASEGARVACVSRTEENAKKTADEINDLRSESAKAYAVDVADHAAVQKIAARVLEHFGRADILVNNAGVTPEGRAMRMYRDGWDHVITTNSRRGGVARIAISCLHYGSGAVCRWRYRDVIFLVGTPRCGVRSAECADPTIRPVAQLSPGLPLRELLPPKG